MTIFRVFAILVLGGIAGVLVTHLRLRSESWKVLGEFLMRHFRKLVEVRMIRPVSEGGELLAQVRELVYRAALLLSLVLAVTGFVPVIFLGEHLTGVLLLIHVTIAPFFALLIAAAALLWAHHQRLDEQHFILLKKLISRQPAESEAIRGFTIRVGFWLLLLLSLPLMLSIILGMFPLFGTDGERMLICIHGYSALCITAVVLIHTYMLICRRDATIGEPIKEETQ
jgi:hypothetical protein